MKALTLAQPSLSSLAPGLLSAITAAKNQYTHFAQSGSLQNITIENDRHWNPPRAILPSPYYIHRDTEKQKNRDNARLTISYRVTPVYVQKLALGVMEVRGELNK